VPCHGVVIKGARGAGRTATREAFAGSHPNRLSSGVRCAAATQAEAAGPEDGRGMLVWFLVVLTIIVWLSVLAVYFRVMIVEWVDNRFGPARRTPRPGRVKRRFYE
jgi:hypothetical protein